MLSRITFLVPMFLILTATASAGPKIDPGFYGFWVLEVEKSDFGNSEKPKAGLVNWSENGWVFAVSDTSGGIYADAVEIKRGCTLIGVPSDFSCEVKIITSTHLRLWLREGADTRRQADIELVDKDTTRTTHRVTPAHRPSYVETTIWHRQSNH